jgi:hypothetical protein
MSMWEVTLFAALRGFLVAALVVAAAFSLQARMRGCSARLRSWLFAAGALAYFTPTMLAGYGWLPVVAQWPAHSAAREVFYVGALFLRLAPVGALILWLANPGPTSAAAHAWKLAGGSSWRFHWREAGAGIWLTAGVVFLLAFQEFDLATSWGARSWTVSLFDAQIGGLALQESLRLMAVPLMVELAVIIPLIAGARGTKREALRDDERGSPGWVLPILIYGAAPLAFYLFYPAAVVFRLGADAFQTWFESPSMLPEITHAFASGAIAAIAAWILARTRSGWLRTALVIPGLLGSLLLGLCVLGGLQFFPSAADTVVPWMIGLTLQLLPVALLLQHCMEKGTDRPALHQSRLAGARVAEWTLWRERAVVGWSLLFCLGYGDFTLSSLLAPPQFSTAFPRVFNLMHYGQSAVLSFSVTVAVLAPLAVAALTFSVLRLYVRSRVR